LPQERKENELRRNRCLFKQKTRDEWLKLTEVHDICLSPIHELEDSKGSPAAIRQMIIEKEHAMD
jgi:crotonobetainyl-CoA:carnitine CoA-transferase CaiB-like acyl-CoA transferase